MNKATYFYLLRRGFFSGGGAEGKLVNDFRTRVIGDGGTFEDAECMRNDVRFLLNNP